MHCCWGVILAAGHGLRTKQGTRKQYLLLDGLPVFWHSALNLAKSARVQGLVLALPNDTPEDFELAKQKVSELEGLHSLGLPYLCVAGGAERQDSVRAALGALPKHCDYVLIHDSARPFASPSLVSLVLNELEDGAIAVVPGLKVVDTIKEVQVNGAKEQVAKTLARNVLRAVQTPQGFKLNELKEAHLSAQSKNISANDDATLMECCGYPVNVVEGELENIKITTPADLKYLAPTPKPAQTRVAFGYDVHAYGGNRPLVLGGVEILGSYTVKAHSDGDVLLHALMDAILGCLGAGDIGMHFPDNDPAYDNISSGVLLAEVMDLAERSGLKLNFVDLTVVAEAPKIAPYRKQIVNSISNMLHLPASCINLKATTEEKLGFTGEKKGLKAMACVSAEIF